MEVKAFVLIVLFEALGLTLLALLGALFYAQKLKRLLAKASRPAKTLEEGPRGRAQEIHVQQQVLAPVEHSYTDYIDMQIINAREHHKGLNGVQDIALDIDPNVPLERRIAAVRHAVLIAEREATFGGNVDWGIVQERYKQLLRYYEDYPSPKAEARINELNSALKSSQQQLSSLEKYKNLYFDLEASWHASKAKADEYYSQIKVEVGRKPESHSEGFVQLVDDYHRSYDSVTTLFESQTPLPETIEMANAELSELRRMTAEQHRIIDHLKTQINNATSDNEKVTLIRELEKQLERQQRFLRESESCVKLMEDELSLVHKELQNFKAKVKDMPNLRSAIKDLKGEVGVGEVMIERLKADNSKLKAELSQALLGGKVIDTAKVADVGANVGQLEEELANLKKKYAELEERYLDLTL